ncbi:6601_t:CDS:2, partial [Acaulospora morrowiae]
EDRMSNLGPAAYLSQVEELPITTNEEPTETLEEKIKNIEVAEELAKERVEQAKELLLRESDVLAQLPANMTNKDKQRLIEKSKQYVFKDGIMYIRDQKVKERLLYVIQWHEVELILFLMYTHPLGGHLGKEAMI